MADNNIYNDNNGFSDNPKVRHLEEILDEIDTYDYDPAESVRLDKITPGDRVSGRSYGTSGTAPRRRADSSSISVRPSSDDVVRRTSASERPQRSSSQASGTVRSQSDRSGRTQAAARTARSSSASRTTRSSSDPDSGYHRPSQTSGTRVRTSSASRSRQNSIKRKKKKFKKLLLIYIAALIVILIVGSIIFSIYLASYENGLPSHVAESIVDSYSSQEGIVAFVKENADKTTIIDNIDDTANAYATNIAGKAISYMENNDFRPTAPSYDILADGSTVAKVTLGQESSNSKWTVTNLNISDYLPNSMSVTVQAPAGATVKINDRVLDASYVTATGIPEVLQNSLSFIPNPPTYDTYQLSGLVTEPVITVTDASGTALTVSKNDNVYLASQPADADFIATVEDRVYAAIDSYATYFINMSFDLKNYIALNSDLWTYIFGSDTMDPIATSLYMFEDILSYDFIERSAGNYIKYGDDCFTVDIKYALDMVFTNPTYSDDNQKMDATWVFVIDDYDGSWCISDIINH